MVNAKSIDIFVRTANDKLRKISVEARDDLQRGCGRS